MNKLLIIILFFTLLIAGCSADNFTQTSPDLTLSQEVEEVETEVIDENQEFEVDIVLAEMNIPLTEKVVTTTTKPEKSGKLHNSAKKPNLNKYVLNVIKTYDIGKYPYLMNNDYNNYNGVTTNLVYQDKILAQAHPSGNRASHCVGVTFEVFFKAMQQRNQDLGISIDNINGMTWQELYDFMLTWYVAKGDKSTSNIAVAVEKYGIGKRITNLEDARPGDFIDISREDNTGHTAVFINWIRNNGKIIGVRYWSSQQSTNGINYKNEYFNILDKNSNKYGNVNINNVYIARI